MKMPATGLYGPGDFPEDFVTIEERRACMAEWSYLDTMPERLDIDRRNAVVDALLDLAHDLDARGLVTVEEYPIYIVDSSKLGEIGCLSPGHVTWVDQP